MRLDRRPAHTCCFFKRSPGLSTATRAITERVCRIDQSAEMLSTLPDDALSHRRRSSTSRAVADADDGRRRSRTPAPSPTRATDRRSVKHGVVPACSNWPGVISLSTTVPAMGARMSPSMRDRRCPASMSLMTVGSTLSDTSACSAASRSASALAASVSACAPRAPRCRCAPADPCPCPQPCGPSSAVDDAPCDRRRRRWRSPAIRPWPAARLCSRVGPGATSRRDTGPENRRQHARRLIVVEIDRRRSVSIVLWNVDCATV